MAHIADGIEIQDEGQPTAPHLTRGALLKRSALAGAAMIGGGALATTTSALAGAAGSAASAEYPGNAAWDAAVRGVARGRTLTIGYTPPAGEEYYNEIVGGAFSQMQEYHRRFGINWVWKTFIPTSHESVETQIGAIQGWTSQKVDAILVCTAGDFATMNRVYGTSMQKGVHIYQFNMPAELWDPTTMNSISSIGYNNATQSGYIAGQYIAQKLGGRGSIILIWGIPGHWATSRYNGLTAALKSYPNVKIVGFQRGNYVRDQGLNAAQSLLQRNPHVNAIYGENDEMALGASQAISLQGLKHWDGKNGILVMGADGTHSGYQSIRSGQLTASVNVNAAENGRQAINAIFYHEILKYTVQPVINVPTIVVDRTNVTEPDAYALWSLSVPTHF